MSLPFWREVVTIEFSKELCHADGLSPSDVIVIPEGSAKDNEAVLSQQSSDPPISPLQQPKS